MKHLILALSLLLSFACAGRKTYTIPKTDFTLQFSDSGVLRQVYCFTEEGEQVWLYVNANSILTVVLADKKEKALLLQTVHYRNGNIEAEGFSAFAGTRKSDPFPLDDVVSLTIRAKAGEQEFPYVNFDSSRAVARAKNDSLRNTYTSGTEQILCIKEKGSKDTLLVAANACYHILFRDKIQTEFGVVQQITADSIFISNSFNPAMANADKRDYLIFRFAIKDIVALQLLRSGGTGFKTVRADNADLFVSTVNRDVSRCPYWFAVNPTKGSVDFYRSWLTARGYIGIREEAGKAFWYEGE